MPTFYVHIHSNDDANEWFGGVFLDAPSIEDLANWLQDQPLPCDRDWRASSSPYCWAGEIPDGFKNSFLDRWVWNTIVADWPVELWEPFLNAYEEGALRYLYSISFWSRVPIAPPPRLIDRVVLADLHLSTCEHCH